MNTLILYVWTAERKRWFLVRWNIKIHVRSWIYLRNCSPDFLLVACRGFKSHMVFLSGFWFKDWRIPGLPFADFPFLHLINACVLLWSHSSRLKMHRIIMVITGWEVHRGEGTQRLFIGRLEGHRSENKSFSAVNPQYSIFHKQRRGIQKCNYYRS